LGIQSFETKDLHYVTLDPMRITEGMKVRPNNTWLSQINELPYNIVLSLIISINQTDALQKLKVASDGKIKKTS